MVGSRVLSLMLVEHPVDGTSVALFEPVDPPDADVGAFTRIRYMDSLHENALPLSRVVTFVTFLNPAKQFPAVPRGLPEATKVTLRNPLVVSFVAFALRIY